MAADGKAAGGRKIGVGAIGCGNFMRRQHLQTIDRSTDLKLVHLADIDSKALTTAAERFAPARTSSRFEDVIADTEVQVLVVGVVPAAHPVIVRAAIKAGKAIYVEKPIAETVEDAMSIHRQATDSQVPVAVGFNRRFAPAVEELKAIFDAQSRPVSLHYRISDDQRVWPPNQDWKKTDRLLTETVHIFDLLTYLIAAEPVRVYAVQTRHNDDLVTMQFEDGSAATIHSSSYGSLAQPKEHLSAVLNCATAEIDDFVELRCFGLPGRAARTFYAGRAFDGCDNSHVEAFAKEGVAAYLRLRKRYNDAIVASGLLADSGGEQARHRFFELIGTPPPPQINYCPDKGWGPALETFCRCVVEGVTPINADASAACRANVCAAAARQSIEHGRPIELDLSAWQG